MEKDLRIAVCFRVWLAAHLKETSLEAHSHPFQVLLERNALVTLSEIFDQLSQHTRDLEHPHLVVEVNRGSDPNVFIVDARLKGSGRSGGGVPNVEDVAPGNGCTVLRRKIHVVVRRG
jgi:hypothetical protein